MSSRLSIETLWDAYGFSPNPKQKEAILYTDGPLFLTAGPGSGKTRVLLWRTLNLIVFHGVKPEEIFLSTFTEKAAHQLKEGLRSLLGMVTNLTGQQYDISGMSLGTVHSICQEIIKDRRFTSDGSRQNPPVLMDALSQYFRLYNRRNWNQMLQAVGLDEEDEAQKDINRYFSGRDSTSRHYAVQNCIKLFNRFSEECLEPDEVDAGGDNMLDTLLEMYSYYKQSLKDGRRIETVDFSLLQQKAFDKIQAYPEAGKVFKHVIIDEYQDTNFVQERLFFSLAGGHQNICVVGDDDQALYRFRGATVENLVEFESRCVDYLKTKPHRINLNTNYRSKKEIVDFYVDFIEREDWQKESGDGHYRVTNKEIKAHDKSNLTAVVTTEKNAPEAVCEEVAAFVRQLKEKGKIQDYNQAAFLFPSLQSAGVARFMEALEAKGIPVYAPRAGRFLEVEEARAVYGLIFHILGRPNHQGNAGQGLQEFRNWTIQAMNFAEELMEADPQLTLYVKERQAEVNKVARDFEILENLSQRKNWNREKPIKLEMIREMASAPGLSESAQKNLTRRGFFKAVEKRQKEGNPYTLKYIINRVTSLDWSVLDLFYQLTSFRHFRQMFKLAEDGTDEGPVCNLGLITQYLARFTEEYTPLIGGSFLQDNKFANVFVGSYTYALFRLGESEYENDNDPFPKGRVPFMTIHQAKGLEFPIVVLGSLYRRDWGADKVETVTRELLDKEGEPLGRIGRFDNMRMFYVALSRAKNLVILPQGKRQSVAQPFKDILAAWNLSLLQDLDIQSLPEAKLEEEDLGKAYSYTGDYLSYQQCPRSYMIFRKYGFVPSRSLTMFFGSLVHQTIEDLHHLLIQQRLAQQNPEKV